jgi:Na+-translocating ferredoxin:NAD+ oxidoreductase RnfG subunit
VARSILAFMVLVICCGVLIAATAALTGQRIEDNRARQFLETLTALTGSARAAADVQWSGDVAGLCPGKALLRGQAQGYGGAIRWLAAADLAAGMPRLDGVRITAHQETPGIADFLDRPEDGWLASLKGTPAAALARVDGVSGATITSRSLSRALATALEHPALIDADCPG